MTVVSSLRRLERLHPQHLRPDQRSLYDAIVGGPRAAGPRLFALTDEDGCLEGPFNAFLLRPELGMAVQELGAAIRYRTTLPDRAREIAILVVSVHWRASFEWHAHAAVARHIGLDDDQVAAILAGTYEDLPPADARVARLVDALVADGDLDDTAYDDAVSSLGVTQVFELTTLVGYYALLARQLRVFRVAAPAATPFDQEVSR